jgi:hypothetical protein
MTMNSCRQEACDDRVVKTMPFYSFRQVPWNDRIVEHVHLTVLEKKPGMIWL